MEGGRDDKGEEIEGENGRARWGLIIPRGEGEGEGGMGKRIEGEGQNKTLRGVGKGWKGKDNPKTLGFGKVQCIC